MQYATSCNRSPSKPNLNKRSELGLIRERENRAFVGRDDGWKGEIRSLLVAVALAKVVLEDGIHDAADAKGRFDDGRNHLLHVDFLFLPFHGHLILGDFYVALKRAKVRITGYLLRR